ncbi:DUF1801 domain-containing protein [Paraflavitalea pollutisoli]|uniref:DUF1801 domain-containing protein n=1 Tax=Paraflavitalea pollutisoli TaxID=3034143 RepID=UPI0023EB7DAB|nr:DUF1801 domain-containing protein [Paraflavitalea sp. H1-2-19X]
MPKNQNKTTATSDPVATFLKAVTDDAKRADGIQLAEIMEEETGFAPTMWGPSIVGFGTYHYVYDSGREGDAPLAGYSPRKDAISLYLMLDPDKRDAWLEKLGKHKSGKGCIYVKKLSDVDLTVLRKMIRESVKYLRKLYPSK